MDLNKFTEKSQAALTEAQAIGTRHQHQAVDVEHLALALLEQEEGLVPRLLQKAGVSPDLVKEKLQEALDRIPRISGDTMTGQGLYVTQRLNKLLVTAQDEAKKLKDDYVSGATNNPGSIWWVGLGCNGLWSRAPETQLMA
jgi:ATP-dependent Clp protease ATP-binding subunit ClpB